MTKIIRLIGILAVLIVITPTVAAFAGVDDDINDFVGRQNRHYWETQPIHFYEYSAIRDTMIQIQDATIPEMKDTWTVFYLTGRDKPVDSCFSQGLPIPGSYQITNPQYAKGGYKDGTALDQPEPSGVYTSGDNWQTWVMCVLPNGQVSPVVWEDVTMVYFSPVHVDPETGEVIHDDGGSSAPIVVR